MVSYKLQYFNVRGLAETTRMMFKISKTPFEDARFNFSVEFNEDGTPNWATIQRKEFDEAKASGALKGCGAKVPALYVDGKMVFGQSKAIERYVAKQIGMFGANDVEGGQIDAVCETVVDMKAAYTAAKANPEDKAKFFAEGLPAALTTLEGCLDTVSPSASDFLVGAKISLADVVVYHFLASPGGFFDDAEAAAKAFAGCPRIAKAMAAVGANPELQAWIASRPESKF